MKFCQRKCGRGKEALFALDFFFYNLAVNLNTPAICIMVSDNILSSFTIRVFLSPRFGDQETFIAEFKTSVSSISLVQSVVIYSCSALLISFDIDFFKFCVRECVNIPSGMSFGSLRR